MAGVGSGPLPASCLLLTDSGAPAGIRTPNQQIMKPVGGP